MRSTTAGRALGALLASVALVLALAAPADATHGQAHKAVPFRAVIVSGVDVYLEPTCPGAVWDYFGEGAGLATHLGRLTYVQSHCSYFDHATMTGHAGPSRLVLAGANGDTLVLEATAQIEVVIRGDTEFAYLEIAWHVIDGTGRFVGATGSGGGSGFSELATLVTTQMYWGSIAYDASSRLAD